MAEQQERVRTIVRREPLIDKKCPLCGREFTGISRQTFCSNACANQASYRRHAERRRAERRERYRAQKQERAKEGSDGGE